MSSATAIKDSSVQEALDQRKKIETDPDFIALKRFGYSLAVLVERHPEGVPDKMIAQALLISEAEVEELYEKAVASLRALVLE